MELSTNLLKKKGKNSFFKEIEVETDMSAKNNKEVLSLLKKGYTPLCPECERHSILTNFHPKNVGGKHNDKNIVFICSDMGHCIFPVIKSTKWTKK